MKTSTPRSYIHSATSHNGRAYTDGRLTMVNFKGRFAPNVVDVDVVVPVSEVVRAGPEGLGGQGVQATPFRYLNTATNVRLENCTTGIVSEAE